MNLSEITNKIHVKLTFIDECLGTAPNNEEIYRKYIASKASDAPSIEEEVDSLGVDELTEQGMTVFMRDEDGNPIMFNYQIRGFFKSACKSLREISQSLSSEMTAYQKNIDLRIFVFEDINDKARRKIRLNLPDNTDIGNCQRPLRANTAQGERIALANSETVPAGTTMEFWVEVFKKKDLDTVREWLDFGAYNGLGQWRNSGKGAFVWEELYATDKDPNFVQVPEKEKKTRGRKKKSEEATPAE